MDFRPLNWEVARIVISTAFLLVLGFNSLSGLSRYHWKWLIITGLLGTFFPSFFFAFAQLHIDSSVAAILNSLTPIFTVLVGITLFATRMLARQYFGVVIGFVGSLGLVWGGAQINPNQPIGYILLIISASMCYAINIHFLKHKLSAVSPMAMTLGNFIAILPPALIMLFFSDFFSFQKLQKPEVIMSLGYVATLAFFGTAIAQSDVQPICKNGIYCFCVVGNIHPSYSCPFLGHLGWRENKRLPIVIHCGNTCRRFFSTQEKQVTNYLVWIYNSFF